ncbi:MAG: aryl-sulfate sulfotransferase [Cyclobacteriaceae bacterium]
MIKLLSINTAISICLFSNTFFCASAQNNPTIGVTFLDSEASSGYTLFAPESHTSVFLINNCGGVINEWTFRDEANRSAYLLPNGNVIRAGNKFLELRNWDNVLLWAYNLEANNFGLHHDIEPLPNGNILCIVYDYYSRAEMNSSGRNPEHTDEKFKLDKIVELKIVGSSSVEIVWEWKLFDHLVQDLYPSKKNYGIVSQSPELVNINYNLDEGFNFSHINGIDYNEDLDQILFSARNLSEIYIIDHSVSSEQAATHTGGNSGMGGDIIWRWGNPQVYNRGSSQNQILIGQHDPKWVPNGYPDQGSITVFNNRPAEIITPGDSNEVVSSSIEIVTPLMSEGTYTMNNNTFGPATPTFSWSGDILDKTMIQAKKSGVETLANGNLLICESSIGRISEIDKEGKLYWSYTNPQGNEIHEQYSTSLVSNSIFRAQRYPLDYSAFAGKNLTSSGFLEDENTISSDCGEESREISTPTTLNNTSISDNEILIVNPSTNGNIDLIGNLDSIEKINISSITGQLLYSTNSHFEKIELSLPHGVYLIQIQSKNAQTRTERLIVDK